MEELDAHRAQPPAATAGLWLGFGALCVGMFMAILDIQVVVTSLSVIEDALKIGADRMSWVQTTYLIAEIISIPLTGLLIRVFTIRWLFAGAITMFTLASIGCALSYDFASLIVFRVLQGFAGGVLIPLVFAAIFLLFGRGLKQTIATTIGGLLAVLAPTLGPITGGWITENYTWHWLFLINVVPGIVTLAIGMLCLPRSRPACTCSGSWTGFPWSIVAVGLAALLIGLKDAPDLGWLAPRMFACFAIFAAVRAYLAIRRPKPAIDFALLRDRNLAYGCILSFILGVGLSARSICSRSSLPSCAAWGPLDIGLVMLVTGMAQLVTAPVGGADRPLCGCAPAFERIGFAAFAIGLLMSGFRRLPRVMTRCSGRRSCAVRSWPCASCRPSASPWASFRARTLPMPAACSTCRAISAGPSASPSSTPSCFRAGPNMPTGLSSSSRRIPRRPRQPLASPWTNCRIRSTPPASWASWM